MENVIFLCSIIEPRTGQRFRSLVAIERYLTQANENTASPKALKPGNQVSVGLVIVTVEVGRVWLELPSPIILINQIQAVLGNRVQLG